MQEAMQRAGLTGTHQTTSLQAAAALVASGAAYRGTGRGPGGAVVFLFDDQDGVLAQMERRYYRGNLKHVQPKALMGAFYRLRADLYATKDGTAGDGR